MVAVVLLAVQLVVVCAGTSTAIVAGLSRDGGWIVIELSEKPVADRAVFVTTRGAGIRRD